MSGGASTPPGGKAIDVGEGAEGAPRPAPMGAKGGDPRRLGDNYFVLARDSRAGAQRLIDFLDRRGVEAIAVSGENGRIFKVVAIDHAFPRDQLGGGIFKSYREKLVELGRVWEATYDGVVSFEKQGMYAERFDGPVARVVVNPQR